MSEELAILLVTFGTPAAFMVAGAIGAFRKRQKQRALERALGSDVEVLRTGGSVIAFRMRRAGRIFEARALTDHKSAPWFITSTRKASLGQRSPGNEMERRTVPIDDRRVDDTICIYSTRPEVVRTWLARDDVTDGIRRFLSRGDVVRAEVEGDGDAMLRVRNRGAEALHILDAMGEASGFLAVVDAHTDELAGVAFTITGGESQLPVEEAIGGASGDPFGISTADRK